MTRNVAFTFSGLGNLGLSPELLPKFPKEFQEGMAARAGVLGDVGAHHPEKWDLLRYRDAGQAGVSGVERVELDGRPRGRAASAERERGESARAARRRRGRSRTARARRLARTVPRAHPDPRSRAGPRALRLLRRVQPARAADRKPAARHRTRSGSARRDPARVRESARRDRATTVRALQELELPRGPQARAAGPGVRRSRRTQAGPSPRRSGSWPS